MRKITLLFSIVCAFMLCATVSAQTLVSELENKGIKSVSATPVSSLDELQENEWYFMVNEATSWANPTGLSSYCYDDGSGLTRGANGSTISLKMLTADCGKGLFRITNRKTAQVGDIDVVGFNMQWGTGNYTVWPLSGNKEVHGGKMWAENDITSIPEHRKWVYAAPVTYNGTTWFQLMRNTNPEFTGTWSELGENGKNIMISGHKGADNVTDYSYPQTVVVSSSSTASALFWKIYKVELFELAKVTVHIKNGEEASQADFDLYLVPGTTVTLRDHLRKFSFVTFNNTQYTVQDGEQEVNLGYTVDEAAEAAFPFASSYEELNTAGKWQSMFTANGRMHVYDENTVGNNTKKYPTTDRATFTGLTDNYFWGFVRANRFSPVKIYNKGTGAGADKTLYLTSNGDDVPVLFPYGSNTGDSWYTDNWVIEKGSNRDGTQYFGVRAMGTQRYINNNAGKGFMTTWHQGPNATAGADAGSEMKFTSELDTYETLKERALNAPYEAVYSLNKAARDEIRKSSANTVEVYKTLIADINNTGNNTGFVDWEESKYYFLRNYTPAGQRTFLLGTVNGTAGAGIEITGEDELGNSTDTHMTCSDANAIWQIVTKDGATDNVGSSTGIGVSRTIARHIMHINSGKYFTGVSGNNARQLSDTKTDYYFVNLGAGQLFLKNTQYTGNGHQSMAHPLNCNNSGTLGEGGAAHYKNTRDTWYGIEAKTLKINLNDGGDGSFYATGHFPFAVSLPDDAGMTAYTVESIDENGHMNLAVAEGEIAANTALIFIGGKSSSKVDIIPGAAEEAETEPILKGVNMAYTFDASIAKDGVLVLGKDADGNVGFFKPSDGMTGLRSNSAYLLISDIPNGSNINGLKFNFGGDVTGIDGVNAENKANVIYDLQGRRVNKLSKGLYIVNGKKVIR